MYECLDDAGSGDELTIDELVNTLLRNEVIDEILADDLRERYDDDVVGDTQAVFCKFWKNKELPGDPMDILREYELV